MILFVDYEHAEGYESKWGSKLLAARTRITYRLEDLADQHCMLVRYDRVTEELVAGLDVKALFISGNGTPPSRYDPTDLEPLRRMVLSGELPVFGFCGGFQFAASALGADLVPVEQDVDEEHRHLMRPFSDGQLGEAGYHPVELVGDHRLLDGLGTNPVFRHAHQLEVPKPPPGFDVLASSPITAVQMAVDEERKMLGTQFHPEYYTDEHPAGERLIRNFLAWSGVRPDRSSPRQAGR